MEPRQVPLTLGDKVSREQHVETLVKQGHIMFIDVKTVEEIKNETLLDAYYNVVIDQSKQIKNLIAGLEANDNLLNQFYRAAQRANVRVFRDGKNEITFERL